MITALEEALPGVRYSREEIGRRLGSLRARIPERTAEIDELTAWLTTQIR